MFIVTVSDIWIYSATLRKKTPKILCSQVRPSGFEERQCCLDDCGLCRDTGGVSNSNSYGKWIKKRLIYRGPIKTW